jgi:hypothetical protein
LLGQGVASFSRDSSTHSSTLVWLGCPQDANVDPLVRQQTLGHKPTNGNAPNMPGNNTRPETQRQQIEQALRRWPASLQDAMERISGAAQG